MELHTLEERVNFVEAHAEGPEAVQKQIAALREQIPPGVLNRHDRLRSREKRSVAEVRNGVCSGCHMRVGIGQVPELIQQEVLHSCDYCGRFLYASKDAAIQPEIVVTVPKRKKALRRKASAEREVVEVL